MLGTGFNSRSTGRCSISSSKASSAWRTRTLPCAMGRGFGARQPHRASGFVLGSKLGVGSRIRPSARRWTFARQTDRRRRLGQAGVAALRRFSPNTAAAPRAMRSQVEGSGTAAIGWEGGLAGGQGAGSSGVRRVGSADPDWGSAEEGEKRLEESTAERRSSRPKRSTTCWNIAATCGADRISASIAIASHPQGAQFGEGSVGQRRRVLVMIDCHAPTVASQFESDFLADATAGAGYQGRPAFAFLSGFHPQSLHLSECKSDGWAYAKA